jgi:hypothetical protein
MEVGMKWMSALPLIALAACTAQPPRAPIVAQGGPSCIDLRQVTGRRVIPPSAVLFDVPGPVSYRAELEGRCAARAQVNGSEIVQTETQTTHLCRDDRVRIYDPVEAKATGPRSFPECRIISITPVPHS